MKRGLLVQVGCRGDDSGYGYVNQVPEGVSAGGRQANLLGCRYPKKWGGPRNGLGNHLHG